MEKNGKDKSWNSYVIFKIKDCMSLETVLQV